jgi:large subunit ribosomal protein L18
MSVHSFMSTLSRLARCPLQKMLKTASSFEVPLISKTFCRHLSVDSAPPPSQPKVEKQFVNRNPRNLEFLGIAWRRLGWRFQYPPRDFYHRVVFERTNRHTTAYVEHCSGTRVVTASTKELAIARRLYSMTDLSAAQNIGRVLAQRCQESGITAMVLHTGENSEKSDKFQLFEKALVDGGVDLTEPEEVTPRYEPGIDYSNDEEMSDLLRRQNLVFHLGEKNKQMKHLSLKRKLRHRRRPWPKPTPLEAPSYTFT